MLPRNPNKPQKPKKTGVTLAKFLAGRIERTLKKVPAEHRGFVFAVVRAVIDELEAPQQVPAELVSAEAETAF